MKELNRFTGCLLAGACGDALGYPVEFMSKDMIRQRYGEKGITKPVINRAGLSEVSDDTQMSLFTVNGLIEAVEIADMCGASEWVADGLWPAYQRWHYTQMGTIVNKAWIKPFIWENEKDFVLNLLKISDNNAIFSQRCPGTTCLSGLEELTPGSLAYPRNNGSKGNGGVMRVAPIGLFFRDPVFAYYVGKQSAAITHGHHTGYIAAGVMAYIISELVGGVGLAAAVEHAVNYTIIADTNKSAETVRALTKALRMAVNGVSVSNGIDALGGGWIAEEALAIAVFCALRCRTAKEAIIAAVYHSGDSDSTGAICGNIVGARDGVRAIPKEWLERLELSDFIRTSALNLYNYSRAAHTKPFSIYTEGVQRA